MNSLKKLKLAHSKEHPLVNTVRQLMFEKGINETTLSRQTGIPLTTLHKILAGKTADPRISTVQTLADYFELTIDQLFSGAPQQSKANIQSIPVLSWQQCLDVETTINGLTPSNWQNWSTINYLSPYAFGLISKPSMEPRFPKGTTFIIDPTATAEDGDFVIVVYPNTQEASLRQLFTDGPNQFLSSVGLNTTQDTLDDNVKLIGVVMESKFSLKADD